MSASPNAVAGDGSNRQSQSSASTQSATTTQGSTQSTTQGSMKYVVILALSAGMAGLLYGYDAVSISGAIGFLQELYDLTPAHEGLIVSSIFIGGVVGVGVSGFLSDRIGRRKVMMFGALFFFIAGLFAAFTQSPEQLIAARIIGGLGIGLSSSISITYVTECAPAKWRGTLSSMYQFLCIIGIFLTNIINFCIAQSGSHAWGVSTGWRWVLGIGAAPALVLFVFMLLAPESPRFLMQSGKQEQGFKILERINGTEGAREEAKAIEASIKLDQSGSFSELFGPGLRKALMVGIFLAVFNQAVGQNTISFYGPTIFRNAGFGGNSEFLASTMVGGVELVFTVVGMVLIDRAGRKPLMLWGTALMAAFAIAMALTFMFNAPGVLVVVFACGFIAAFAFSMGPVTWVMIPELFPTHLRGRASGLCGVFIWGTAWLVGQFTPMMFAGWGGQGMFLFFAALDIIGFLGVRFLVPETKGKRLEEIEEFFRPKK
ncbi:sugar porter family MFS transporter [Bifidobacterium simiarum]|uniref:sugar porter family MFS transporter n=1 Tax=Bifidobacterium simiarum TaxID=2045441 RepID=UPI001BDD31E5|nr:sugar porter family MFS transporter [Bifidobacterium simiarum]MBT1165604.1 sugar porter family MFS transporter [Bifidobacterium simiarum]